VSGDVLVVANVDGSAERRVNLSSIRAPRMGNERRGQKSEPWAVEAKEFLRQRCIGSTVKVSMEYARKVGGPEAGEAAGYTLNPNS
jgi:staphylococcal nuclease domain-containing protein 1